MKKPQPLKPMNIVIAQETPFSGYPWKDGDRLLYLGEIGNMPGHCTVVTGNGMVHWGYHINHFRPARVEEV